MLTGRTCLIHAGNRKLRAHPDLAKSLLYTMYRHHASCCCMLPGKSMGTAELIWMQGTNCMTLLPATRNRLRAGMPSHASFRASARMLLYVWHPALETRGSEQSTYATKSPKLRWKITQQEPAHERKQIQTSALMAVPASTSLALKAIRQLWHDVLHDETSDLADRLRRLENELSFCSDAFFTR